MKAYGIRRKDTGCCPGHDKFPTDTFKGRASVKARGRDKAAAHGRERLEAEREIRKELNGD